MSNTGRRSIVARLAIAAVLTSSASACAAVGSRAAPLASGGTGTGNPPGYLRVVRTLDRGWSVQCVNDPCSTTPRFSFDIPTPSGVKSFDLVLTVTMQYRTTPLDRAEASVFYCPALSPPPPCAYLLLKPGQFPMAPAATGDGSTVSLSWSGKGFSASYEAWRYELLITPFDGSGDNAVKVNSRLVTAVFDMRPSAT